MEQERGQRRESSEPAIEGLADRLDAVAAERILQRAIELHASHQDDTYDLSLIEKVAAELDIPSEYVAAAMAEELQVSPSAPPRLIERLFVRDELSVTRIAQMPTDEAAESARVWMGRQEGMQVANRTPQNIAWTRDPSPVVALRAGLKMQQGTGVLRTARAVTTEFRPVGDATAMTVSADARMARAGAITGGTALSIGLSALNGAFLEMASLQFVLAVILSTLVAFAIAVAGTKAWAAGLQRGLERAATGITEPDALESQETATELFGRFREEWRDPRRRQDG